MAERDLDLRVNGERRAVRAATDQDLLTVLRDGLGLTGCKYGCGEAQCGACTVLVDGSPTRSCVTRAGSAAGKEITTIEGLAADGALHPLQEAFLESRALECGFCTTGMIMSALALLRWNPDPSEDEIVRHMDGNLCRCGTYRRIVAAIQDAARRMRGEG